MASCQEPYCPCYSKHRNRRSPFLGIESVLVVVSGDLRPVVGAEGEGGETGAVIKVALWVVGPSVSNGYGVGNVGRGEHHAVPFDLGVGPVPLFIGAGD